MDDVAIGIDLGTTHCCVAVYRDGGLEVIPNTFGLNTTPSYVHIDKDNYVTAGTSAKGIAIQDPTRAVYDVQRLIGRRFDDPLVQKNLKIWPFNVIEDKNTHLPIILLNETYYLPEQISAHVLGYSKACAEEWLNRPVKKAVITVPAYFNKAQCHATKLAGALAGLNVLDIFNEPTAAAVHHCYKNKSFQTEKTVLVFDLGGRTLDVVIMTIKDRKILIKAIGGDNQLGGQDIDRNVVNHCLKDFKAKNGTDLSSVGAGRDEIKVARILRRLKYESEEIKTQLSSSKRCVIALDSVHGDTSLVVKITRDEFERLNNSLFQQCVNIVKAVVKDANLTPADIDEVIMVGGSSKIPKLQELIMGLFPGKKPNKTINADEAACGAAIQAALMTADCPALKNIFHDKITDQVSLTVHTKPLTTPFTNSGPKDRIEFPSQSSTSKTSSRVVKSDPEWSKNIKPPILPKIEQIEKPDKISMELKIILKGLHKQTCDDDMIMAWDYIGDLTREDVPNCARFLKHGGIELFLNCLTLFADNTDLKLDIMSPITNVADVKQLRPQLIKSDLINAFYKFLISTESRVSYRAADFLAQILSEGVDAWTVDFPKRTDVLSRLRRCIKCWEDQPIHDNYKPVESVLMLINVTHTTECQLWAAWNLKTGTKYNPEIYIPKLVSKGGLDILNTIRCEDADVRRWVNITLKRSSGFLTKKT